MNTTRFLTRRVAAVARGLLVRVLIGSLVAGFIVVGSGGMPARAAGPTSLNLTDFGRILVDPATSHVFVSSRTGNKIVVLDLNGNIVKTITGETGADAMVVVGSTLYVSLRTATGSIDRIDTGTLTETSPLVTGLVQPNDLVYAASKLWTTTGGCSGGTTQLASVDPAAQTPTITTYPTAFTVTNQLANCAWFASNHASNPSVLLAGTFYSSPATLTTFDVSGTAPVQLHSLAEMNLGNLQDLAINPDGTHFVAASGSPYEFDEFNMSDLAADGVVYAANAYPTAVDTSAALGGIMVGGLYGANNDKDFFEYQISNPTPLTSVDFGFTTVPARGVAIGPGGSVAFVISSASGPSQPVQLNIIPLITPPPVGAPGAPTLVSASAGVGSATVSWTAPTYSGKSSLTGYTIHSSGGATLTVGPSVTSAVIAGLSPISHTFVVTANNSYGSSLNSPPSNAVTPIAGGTYNAVTPSRVLDTRTGNGGFPIQRAAAGSTLRLQVTGRGGVPATGVSAVVMNVTVANPAGPGYVTAYPEGSSRPATSVLNFKSGQIVPNLVEVAVGTGGKVDLYIGGSSTDILADVAGWVGDSTDSFGRTGLFQPVAPSRILDTRNGNGAAMAKLGAGQSLVLQVGGRGGIPASAVSAVVMNVTVTNPTEGGYLTVYPTGATLPVASNLNFTAGQTVPNRVTVALGTSGQVTIFNGRGSVDVIADVNGWFTDASSTAGGSAYVGTQPTRILDTRSCACKFGPGYVLDLVFNGTTTMSAVVMNVTVTNTSSSGYLTLYPDDGSNGQGPTPSSSDLNYKAHQTVPNLTVLKIGSNRAFNIYNGGAWADVILDFEGYYGVAVTAPPLSVAALHVHEVTPPSSIYLPARSVHSKLVPMRR